MCPEQYQALSKKYSKEWPTLSREDQSMYRLQAQYETEMRSQVKELPLAAKDQPDPTLENCVGKATLKKISAARLQHNFSAAAAHPLWKTANQAGECNLSLEIVLYLFACLLACLPGLFLAI